MSTERQIGMGIGPIPRSAIKAYAEEFEIRGDAYDQFEKIIRAVDAQWLSRVNTMKKDKPEKGTAASPDDVEGTKAVMMRLAARSGQNRRKH